jgi:hypothetical protein
VAKAAAASRRLRSHRACPSSADEFKKLAVAIERDLTAQTATPTTEEAATLAHA